MAVATAVKPEPLFEAETTEERAMKLQSAGRANLAEPLFKKALELKEKVLGADDPRVAETMGRLATSYSSMRKYSEAKANYTRALSIMEKSYYADHPSIGIILEQYGDCLAQEGDYNAAEPLLARALTLREKGLRGDHYELLALTRKLVEAQRHISKFAEAEKALKTSIKHADSPWGPIEVFLSDLALVYRDQGKNAESGETYKQAIDAYEKRGNYPGLVTCLKEYASLLRADKKEDEAKKLETRADIIQQTIDRRKK